jgi:hypothetical protein
VELRIWDSAVRPAMCGSETLTTVVSSTFMKCRTPWRWRIAGLIRGCAGAESRHDIYVHDIGMPPSRSNRTSDVRAGPH